MTQDPTRVAPNMHFVLATRHLERIADHTTNIAEDILFWVRGLDVRHGRALHADIQAAENGSEIRAVRNDESSSPEAVPAP